MKDLVGRPQKGTRYSLKSLSKNYDMLKGLKIRTNYENSDLNWKWIEGTLDKVESNSMFSFGTTSTTTLQIGIKNCTTENGETKESWVLGSGNSGNWFSVESELPKPVTMDSVILEKEKKESIRSVISQQKNHKKIFEDWGFNDVIEKGKAISLLFYGLPGTGKTLMAQAIATELDLNLKIINPSDINDKYYGESEKHIKEVFEDKSSVILFDECDSFIMDRGSVGSLLQTQVNQLLTCLESFEGVVIFTTNRITSLDPAFERRVSLKMEFTLPDKKRRAAIWKRMIPEKCPTEELNFGDLASIEIAGGNIKNAVLNAARISANKNKPLGMKELLSCGMAEFNSLQEFDMEALSQNSYKEQIMVGR